MRPEAAAVIYRTTKEALGNVVKHAAADQVWVCLERIDRDGARSVRLEIADDGVGYPSTGIDRREGHVGLRVLQDRVVDLGGTVKFGIGLDGGAVVTVVLALQHRP
jgi:signal transduction histidine kinase